MSLRVANKFHSGTGTDYILRIGGLVTSSLVAVILILAASGVGRAEDEAVKVVNHALDLVDDDNSRQAVAILADAARRHPQDRKISALLFSLLRDKRWPVPQTLPVKLPGPITVADFSSDEKLVVAGAEDGTVRLLDVATGKLLDVTMKHGSAVAGAAILPGNQLVFSVDTGGVARIWRIADGTAMREWSDNGVALTAYATSKDFKRVALGYGNGEVRVYDSESGAQIGASLKHAKAITGLVFSPDGQALGTGAADGTARVWDLATGKPRGFVIKHKAPVKSVDIDRLGMLFMTASEDGIARISDATNGKPIVPRVDCGAKILDARLGASGICFFTVLADHTVRVWDTSTGELVGGVIRSDDGIVSADWGPGGISIVTASEGPVVDIWRVRNGARVSEGMLHASPAHVASYGPNSDLIVTGCTDGTVRLWREDVGASCPGLPSVGDHEEPVRTAFFSADGNGLVSCADDFTAICWKAGSVRPLGHVISLPSKPVCAAYSPDRSIVATVTEDGKVSLFDGKTDELRGLPRDLGAPGRWVDFARDGLHFLTTAGTRAVVWSVDDPKPSGAAIEHSGKGNRQLSMARFSPDGSLIVTAGADGTARIWDTAARKLLATLVKHKGAVTCARFSFDGKLLVTTGADGSIVVWDTATWKQTGATMILPGKVWSAVIGPNDQFVAATSQYSDGIRYFEIATGRMFTDGIDIPADAVSIDLHPSGDSLAVACADSTVRIYDSLFVSDDIPPWMPEFAEQIVGMRVDGPDKFAPVYTTYDQLKQYPPKGAAPGSDFAMLAKWMVTAGAQRTMSPRTFATIASNIEMRVEERSLDSLYEIFEAAPADPLIFAAMSLYVPTRRQGEFLAEYALSRSAGYPLAQAYAASAFAKYGRLVDAERVMKAALAAAPNDYRVLRRAAKLDALQNRKDEAIAKFERAMAADPEDAETVRTYGWALYNLHEPARAMEQFKKADGMTGRAEDDIAAGLCLSAAAMGDQATAVAEYRRLIKLEADWRDPDYLKQLDGWTGKQLAEMERIRALAAGNH